MSPRKYAISIPRFAFGTRNCFVQHPQS